MMKAVMIICNMIVNEEVEEILNKMKLRGFTRWNEVQGRGTENGDPHLGSHIWPTLNSAFMIVLEEKKVPELLEEIKILEKEATKQGIRAFVWNIEQMV